MRGEQIGQNHTDRVELEKSFIFGCHSIEIHSSRFDEAGNSGAQHKNKRNTQFVTKQKFDFD